MGTVEFASRSTDPGLLLIVVVGAIISIAVTDHRGIVPDVIAVVAVAITMIAHIYL